MFVEFELFLAITAVLLIWFFVQGWYIPQLDNKNLDSAMISFLEEIFSKYPSSHICSVKLSIAFGFDFRNEEEMKRLKDSLRRLSSRKLVSLMPLRDSDMFYDTASNCGRCVCAMNGKVREISLRVNFLRTTGGKDV